MWQKGLAQLDAPSCTELINLGLAVGCALLLLSELGLIKLSLSRHPRLLIQRCLNQAINHNLG